MIKKFATPRSAAITVMLLCLLFPGEVGAGTITGNIQTPTGGPVANGTLTFVLSQPSVLSGVGSIVTTPVSCYTSGTGAVVGLPDIPFPPILSANTSSGTLPAGTYYVRLTLSNAGGVTFPGPEGTVVLSSQGTVIVSAPTLQPSVASGYSVYISSASGTETLQGSVTGFGQYQQSTPLVSGSALPVSNTSVCSIAFSDTLVPTGTSYRVNLLSKTGSPVSGFPQTWCTYGGLAGTINVSNGAPTGNCSTSGVYYPTPILATPLTPGGTQTVNGTLNIAANFSVVGSTSLAALSVSGAATVAGNFTATAESTIKSLHHRKYAADFNGSDASAKIQAAINALPTTGGIVDASDLSDAGGTGSTTIDPCGRAVTLYLGPYTYNLTQVVLRNNFQIVGAGHVQQGAPQGTVIQSVGSNATPLFVLGQNGACGTGIVYGVHLADFRALGAAGNTTQDAFSLIAAASNTGLWYSRFSRITTLSFKGRGLYLQGTTLTSLGNNQFNVFETVSINRPTGALPGFSLFGANGNNSFINCYVQGQSQGDATNVLLDSSGTAGVPYSTAFYNLVNQQANVGISIGVAVNTQIVGGHFEAVNGAVDITAGNSTGTVVTNSVFTNNTGVNAGNGYLARITLSTSSLIFTNNNINVFPPDRIIVNSAGVPVVFANNIGYTGPACLNPGCFGQEGDGTALVSAIKVNGTPQFFFVAADFTTANNANLQTITGLSWTLAANAVQKVPFSCHLLYSQATAAVADQFGVQAASLAPTNFMAKGTVQTNATVFTSGNLPALTTTTATAVVTFTPSAITTIWEADLDGFIENPSGVLNTINIMVQTSAGADAVTVKKDSFCRVN